MITTGHSAQCRQITANVLLQLENKSESSGLIGNFLASRIVLLTDR